MPEYGWLINASFLAGGAFTFLRLTASARRGLIAAHLAKKLAEEAKKNPPKPAAKVSPDVVLTSDPN